MLKLYESKWAEAITLGYSHINQLLFESRGVNEELYAITDELYNLVINTKPQVISIGRYQISLPNYPIQTKGVFLNNLSFTVMFGLDIKEEELSRFSYSDHILHLSDNGQLEKIQIKLYLHNNENIIDKKEFYSHCLHELQHAYWFWNILKNDRMEDEQKRMSKYNKLQFKDSDENIEKLIKMIFYTLDKNEISAKAVQLFDYVIQNKNIVQDNTTEEFQKTNFYKDIKWLQDLTVHLDDLTQEKQIEFGQAYIKIFDTTNLTPQKAFKALKQAILGGQKYMLDKYYQVIGNALEKAINENKEAFRQVHVLRGYPRQREIMEQIYK